MASRAATLVKPKPKAKSKTKATAKTLATKSLVAKPAASAKSASVAPASKTASAQLKASSVKDSVSKTVVAKASASKPAAIKPSLAKVAKPAAAKANALDKPGALKVKAKASSGDESVVIAGTASFEPAAPKPRRRSKGEIRTRIYWAVFNQSLRRVAVFEFDQRGEAEKRAAKLAKVSGEHHFIQKIKAIVQ